MTEQTANEKLYEHVSRVQKSWEIVFCVSFIICFVLLLATVLAWDWFLFRCFFASLLLTNLVFLISLRADREKARVHAAIF